MRFKRVIKFLRIIILSLALLFALLLLLVNLPFSQRHIASKLNRFFLEKQLPVHIEKITLLVNGKIGLKQLRIIQRSDTIAFVQRIRVDVRLVPLLFKKIKIGISINDAVINLHTDSITGKLNVVTLFSTQKDTTQIKMKSNKKWDIQVKTAGLQHVRFTYDDAFHGIHLKQSIGKMYIRFSSFSLLRNQIDIAYLDLETARGDMVLNLPVKEKASKTSVPSPWKFSIQNSDLRKIFLSLDQPSNKQRIEVALGNGNISGVYLDLLSNQITLEGLQLEEPALALYSSDLSSPIPAAETVTVKFSFPGSWNISGKKIKINTGSIKRYGYDLSTPKPDKNELSGLKKLNTTIKSFGLSSRASDLTITRLSFGLDNGIQLKRGSLIFNSDSALTSTLKIDLQTQFSQVKMDIEAGKDLSALIEKSFLSVPVSLNIIKAEISPDELFAFSPEFRNKFSWPSGKNSRFVLKGTLHGSTDSMQIDHFSLYVPAGISFSASGYLTNLSELRSAGCGINFGTGTITHSQVKELMQIAGSTSQLPFFNPMIVQGRISNRLFAPGFTLTIKGNSGNVEIDGSIDISQKTYAMNMSFSNLAVGELAGIKELERFTGRLNLNGNGFDADSLMASAVFTIDTFCYKGYQYSNINAAMQADKGHYTFDMRSSDTAFGCNLTGHLNLLDSLSEGQVSCIFNLQPGRLNLYHDSIDIKGEINASLNHNPEATAASIDLKNLTFRKGDKTEGLKQAIFSIQTADSLIKASVEADFFHAVFQSHASVDDLKKAIKISGLSGFSILDSAISYKLPIISAIPDVHFSVESTYDPIIDLIIPDSIFGYHQASFTLTKDIDGITKGNLDVDNYNFKNFSAFGTKLKIEGLTNKTVFTVKSDSMRIGNFKLGTSLIDLNMANDIAGFRLKVFDNNDRVLYEVASEAIRKNKRFELKSTQPQWILNGNAWTISPVEYLTLEPETNDFSANLQLKHNQTNLAVYGRKSEKLSLDCKEVWISMLVNPEIIGYKVNGELSGKIDYINTDQKKIGIKLDIRQIKFGDTQVGRMEITGNYISDTLGNVKSNLYTVLNDTATLTLTAKRGKKDIQEIISADFRNIPVLLLEPFVGKYISGLRGDLSGGIALTFPSQKPQLNGKLLLNETTFKIEPLNAQFTITADEIVLTDNQMLFRQFIVLDSMKRRLKVNGKIDLNDRENINADLQITTDNLQVMNTTEKENPAFNGSVFINSKLNISGPVQKPSIKGNLALAGGTVINYRYTEDLTISETQKTITFASLSDNLPEAEGKIQSIKNLTKSPYMEASIEIDPKSIFNFQISHGYDIGAKITGGGFLNYSLLPNNTASLSGTYEIQQGSSDLKIIGWPRKFFSISQGSYLKWDGEIDDPVLNLLATSKVRGSYLNPVDNKTREVDFIVSMKLANRLSQLEIAFNVLSADQYILSVLNSLSQDERMRQAINLLIFERIELPNMSSSSSYLSQQINQFWESQLNQFTKSTIKNVDISFGINTYTGASTSGGEQEYTSFTYEVKKDLFKDRGSVMISGRMNDNSPAGAQANTMIENFIFEYALDTNQSKYLKVYRQQNYEDLLEGEVTKSGVGFIYRKNYDKFRELWRRKKRKAQNE